MEPVRLASYRHELVVLVLVALATLPVVELAGPQDRTRYELTRHLVLHHSLAVEAGLFDRAVYGGRTYSDKAPGMSFLAVVPYQAERIVGVARAPADWQPEGDLSLWGIRVATSGLLFLVLVFLVLIFEFRTFAAPISILASAVLSTSGVFFALLITGTDFNISSFMGLLMVVGIVSKNGILLLDADEKFRAAGFSRAESIFQAGRRRLRPIVMTAIAAVVGMLPLALAIGAGSQMLQPLAIAVIGGLLIAMILSLFVTPTIYYYMTKGAE